MVSAIEDIEFLAGSAYRADSIREMVQGPCDRDTLREVTGASKATIARLLNELEERNWVERNGHQYELTDPGRFVAEAFIDLADLVETEQILRKVWQYLPTELPNFSIGLFQDAVITFTEPGSQYEPIPRTVELIESADTMRLASKRLPKKGSLEAITRNAADGMKTTLIFPAEVVNEFLESIRVDAVRNAVQERTLTIMERDSFPTDSTLVLYDDRIGLYCRDELGVTRFSIDTDGPEAYRWGAALYEDVLSGATPVDRLERAF